MKGCVAPYFLRAAVMAGDGVFQITPHKFDVRSAQAEIARLERDSLDRFSGMVGYMPCCAADLPGQAVMLIDVKRCADIVWAPFCIIKRDTV